MNGSNNHVIWSNERRRLADLIPWPRNPRQLDSGQARRLVESFDQFGQVETIAIGPGNEIYNGHQRLNVLMEQNGGDYQVDVRVASRILTEKEREKLIIFLHKGAAGDWDFDILAHEFSLEDLLDWGFNKKDLDLDMWSDGLPKDHGAQIDRAEELCQLWGVELGQLWELGNHRLLCGDCTIDKVVDRVMDGKEALICWTDPPYNVALNKDKDDSRPSRQLANDNLGKNFPDFCKSFIQQIYRVLSPGGILYMTMGAGEWPVIDAALRPKFYWSSTIVWVKQSFVMNRKDYHNQYEPMWYGWKTGEGNEPINIKQEDDVEEYLRHYISDYDAMWYGWKQGAAHLCRVENRKQSDVWFFDRPLVSAEHPTMKPIGLVERALFNSSSNDDIVFDPFVRSGTTLVACERLGRRCRALDCSPPFCAVTIQRWVDMTGGTPKLVINE